MNKLKRLWIRIKKPALYGAILECERLQKKIAIKKRYHEKYSHLQKQLYDVRARIELMKQTVAVIPAERTREVIDMFQNECEKRRIERIE